MYNVFAGCYEISDNGDGTVTITNYDKTCGSEVNITSIIKGKVVTAIDGTSWDDYKLFNYKKLTKVTILDTVKYIGSCAFWGNYIISLDLGNGVSRIEGEALEVIP